MAGLGLNWDSSLVTQTWNWTQGTRDWIRLENWQLDYNISANIHVCARSWQLFEITSSWAQHAIWPYLISTFDPWTPKSKHFIQFESRWMFVANLNKSLNVFLRYHVHEHEMPCGRIDLDIWPQTLTTKIELVHPWLQVKFYSKVEEIPSRCSWNITQKRHDVWWFNVHLRRYGKTEVLAWNIVIPVNSSFGCWVMVV